MVQNLSAMQETPVWSLGQEDPLEKGMATLSSILVWRIPWTEEPGRLQSVESQELNMTEQLTHTHTYTHTHCLEGIKWQAKPAWPMSYGACSWTEKWRYKVNGTFKAQTGSIIYSEPSITSEPNHKFHTLENLTVTVIVDKLSKNFTTCGLVQRLHENMTFMDFN